MNKIVITQQLVELIWKKNQLISEHVDQLLSLDAPLSFVRDLTSIYSFMLILPI